MSAVDLSRIQFATTAVLHFLFVVLTLGLTPLVAIMQTRWAITRREVHERMTRFWGQIYVVNYALGIVAGLVLEFQFGLHWSGLMTFAGDVFGAPLAIETLVAFFLESTFLGMWVFGWGRLNRWVHTGLFWLVTITAYLSAYWVMVANGFLQDPVGHVVENGVAHVDDFGALLTNQQALGALLHIVPACLLTASMLMIGVCSWHFLRASADLDFFRRSLRLAVVTAAVAANAAMVFGYAQFGYLTEGKQLAFGGSAAERADFQERMESLHGPGDWTPPEWLSVPWSFMEVSGTIFWTGFTGLLVFLIMNAFDRLRPAPLRRFWHRFYVWIVPWPFVVVGCGWLLREVGRQPWVVYGELPVTEAVSPHGPGTVLASLVGFGCVLVGLAIVDWFLIARLARRGPHRMALGADVATVEHDDAGAAATGDERLALAGKD